MLANRRIGAADYYDLLPQAHHQCGDIWCGVNTVGLLGRKSVAGVVVTPACDLAQKKSETVTFLPIVPLRAYFSTLAAFPDVKRTVSSALKAAGFDAGLQWSDFSFRPPNATALTTALERIEQYLSIKQRGAKEISNLKRAEAGLRVARAIAAPDLTEIAAEELASTFPDWEKVKVRMIRNSYSSDLHFLPADGQSLPFTGLMSHSLVMFRYPVTVPIEVLDLASTATEVTWPGIVDANVSLIPSIDNYRSQLPLKTSRLKSEFLSDLLSRYVTVFNRIGSPDFTDASIARIASDVDNS